jgi:hypothetical protein
MVTRCALLILVLQLAVLVTVAGCQSTPPGPPATATAEPAPSQPRESGTGMLMRTGAIQLGPDVGRNQWRWQGDGKGGF